MHRKNYNNICRECGCRLDPGEGSLCEDCKTKLAEAVAGKVVKHAFSQDVHEVDNTTIDCLNSIVHVVDYE